MNSKNIISILILFLVVGIIGGILVYNSSNTSNDLIDSNNSSDRPKNNGTINNTTDNTTDNDSNETNITNTSNSNDFKSNDSSNSKNSDGKQVKTQNFKKTRLSEIQVIKIANKVIKSESDYYGDPSVINVSKIEYLNGMWFVDFKNIKTGKKVGNTVISDKTGELATL